MKTTLEKRIACQVGCKISENNVELLGNVDRSHCFVCRLSALIRRQFLLFDYWCQDKAIYGMPIFSFDWIPVSYGIWEQSRDIFKIF